MSRIPCLGAVLLAVISVSGGFGMRAQDDCPASHLRNTGRAILCAQVVDERTGAGVPGGDVEFVREDGASMAGTIEDDGTFSINVPAGRGTLTIAWSCRPSVQRVDTIDLPAGQGTELTFRVAVAPADTLCRRQSRGRSDPDPAAVARWMDRGPCFELSLAPWNPALPAEEAPPRWVQLDSADQDDDESSDQPLHFEGSSEDIHARWTPLQEDSIEMILSRDFAGVTLTLGVQGDSLAGRGIWVDDIIVTDSLGFLDRNRYPNGAVSAHRVPCGSSHRRMRNASEARAGDERVREGV